MNIILEHARAIVIHGDSARLGEVLEPNTIDAMVTDPPSGIGFMGKSWDSDKGGRDRWIAWLRDLLGPAFIALKPGAHCVVWALPRTAHYTATALEDAGFEIRDVAVWHYGQGFPKSLNIGKAIDDHLGFEREPLGERKGTGNTSFAGESDGKGLGPTITITKPASPEAEQWDGFGTALKPASEFFVLCRKPIEGSNVAANVLAFGTGGINIAGCRVGTEQTETNRNGNSGAHGIYGRDDRVGTIEHEAAGRWPANLVLSHHELCVLVGTTTETRDVMVRTETVVAATAMAGESTGATASGETFDVARDVYACVRGCPVRSLDDQAGAEVSRFFYTAKPARTEKEAGLKHLPKRGGGEATGRKEGSKGTENPRAGAGRTGGARNFHPTVKPTDLMQWLVRLIAPPGGTILDPFAGSGTTGVAALAEGMSFVGCELGGENNEYLPILVGRISNALGIGIGRIDGFDISDVEGDGSNVEADAEQDPVSLLESGIEQPEHDDAEDR